MTGFAKKNGSINIEDKSYDFSFELKSVNGKGSDVKSRNPSFLGDMNISFKDIVSKYFSRGSFNIFLEVSSNDSEQTFKINEKLLSEVVKKSIEIYESNISLIEKPRASDLLSIKGVLEQESSEITEEGLEVLQKKLLSDFEECCVDLQKSRKFEGDKIKKALLDILKKIETISKNIEKISVDLPKKIREKLLTQIEIMISDNSQISEDRIAQEVVFYVAKADIREEIDRLKAHIETAKELLSSKEPVGRKLDFLCQELNREANTTCSKSIDLELTNYGMELKTLIEQFREQVQNIE